MGEATLRAGLGTEGPLGGVVESRLEWAPVARVRAIVAAGGMPDGLSLTAVPYGMAFGHI